MFDCELYTRPIWDGNEIYAESFLPMEKRIRLLYHADEIIEVSDMRQEKVFTAGKDYNLDKGELVIPDGSEIKIMPWEVYNPAVSDAEHRTANGFISSTGGYLAFAETTFLHDAQYQVTYRHSDGYNGVIPHADIAKLPKVKKLLREKKDFRFGFLGDSIGAGCNASALYNVPPFCPIWPELVCLRLSEKYGIKVTCDNKSVGGMATGWGIDAVEQFKDNPPDLFLIEFGMNDASGKLDEYTFRDNIKAIADKMLSYNPNCEILLVSTTMPNPLASQFAGPHAPQELLLAKLAGEYGERADIVPITSVHNYLMTRKHYYDMTGNNINHPNDFLVRVYAQSILALLGA